MVFVTLSSDSWNLVSNAATRSLKLAVLTSAEFLGGTGAGGVGILGRGGIIGVCDPDMTAI